MKPNLLSFAGFAIVTNIDYAKSTVQCKVTERDDAISPPLRVLQWGTKENKAYNMPALNEQGYINIFDDGNSGVWMGAIYGVDTTHDDLKTEGVQGVVFADGTAVIMDVANSELLVDSRAKVTVTADTEISATVGTCQVSLTTSEVIMKKGTTQVKVAAKVQIKTAAGSLFTIEDNLMTADIAQTHTTPLGPTSPPINVAAYIAEKISLGLTMEA